jgi:hypothetical protein
MGVAVQPLGDRPQHAEHSQRSRLPRTIPTLGGGPTEPVFEGTSEVCSGPIRDVPVGSWKCAGS